MRIHVAFLCVALAGMGCKKSGGGGGGGGGWFTGSEGLLTHVDPTGKVSATVDLGASENFTGIACRYQGEAWVIGAHGSVLYTNDGGQSWAAETVPTSQDLRALATQDAGPVFLAGDGVFLESVDTGATWQSFGDGQTAFRSVAAAQQGTTVLALADDGRLFSFANGALEQRATLPGARALAVSPDGEQAIAVGQGIWRSLDGGALWTQLAIDPSIAFHDVRLAEDGSAVAVGAGGAVANIDPTGAVTVQHAGTADLFALHIADPDAEDALGYTAGTGGAVWMTRDSGLTWEPGPVLGRTVMGVDSIGFGHR